MAAARSPWARSTSQRSSASSARSRGPTWSVISAPTRSTQVAASSKAPMIDGVLAGAQAGRHAHLAVDERAGLEQVVGQQRPGTTAARSPARWPRPHGGAGRGGGSARAGCGSPGRSARAARRGGRRRPPRAGRRRRRRPSRRAARRRRARSRPRGSGSVAAWPATAARLSTCTTRGSRRSRRRPIIARIDSGSSPPTAPSVWRISSVRKNALPPVAVSRSAASDSSRPFMRSSSAIDVGRQGADGRGG